MRFSRLIATLALMGMGAVSSAHAATFVLEQGGYTGGARLTGSFTGVDSNADGYIRFSDGELSAFSIHFSGNSEASAFTLGLADFGPPNLHFPGVFSYDLDGSLDYDSDALQIGNGINKDYIALAGAYQDSDYCFGKPGCGFVRELGSGADQSGAAILITAIPEAATWAMTILGLGAIGGGMRRRRVPARPRPA